jgi:hypothetical protein
MILEFGTKNCDYEIEPDFDSEREEKRFREEQGLEW